MRCIVLTLSLCILSASAFKIQPQDHLDEEKQARIYEDEVQAAIENVRQMIINNNWDPLRVDNAVLDLGELGVPNSSGKVALQNVELMGLAGWLPPQVDISITIFPPGAEFTIIMDWPKIFAFTSYDADTNVMGNTVTGSGEVRATLDNLAVALRGSFNALTGNVRELNLEIILASSRVEMGDLQVNGVDVSERIEETAAGLPTWIIQKQGAINKLMEALVEWINNRS